MLVLRDDFNNCGASSDGILSSGAVLTIEKYGTGASIVNNVHHES